MKYARRCRLGLVMLLGLAGQALAQDVEISGAELVSGQATDTLSALAQEMGQLSGVLRIVAPVRWHGMIGKQLADYLSPDRLQFESSDGQNIAFFLPGTAAPSSGGAKPLAPDTPVAATPSASDASRALRDSARSQVQNLQPQIMGADELLGRTRMLTPDLGQAPVQSGEQTAVAKTSPAVAAPEQRPASPADSVAPTPSPLRSAGSASNAASEAAQIDPELPGRVDAPVIVSSDSDQKSGREDLAVGPSPDRQVSAAPTTPSEGVESAKLSLQKRLNRGRPIDRSIGVGELRRADVLFSTRGVVAVVRSSGTRQRVYWLNGDIDLDRPEIKRERAGRYSVLRPLPKRDIPEVLDSSPIESVAVETSPPSDPAVAEKVRMEKKFNGGRSIERGLSVAALRPDDVLYVGDGRILVARRVQAKMKRYWLNETIDLELEEIEKTGSRRYRVRRQIR